ncbi:MAG TPA: hypothetical protein VII38_15465 [Polyangia bacterium]
MGAVITLALLVLTLAGRRGPAREFPSGPSKVIRSLEEQQQAGLTRDRRQRALAVERLYRSASAQARTDGGADGGQ